MPYFLLTILIFSSAGVPDQIGAHKTPLESMDRCEQQGQRVVNDLASLQPPTYALWFCTKKVEKSAAIES